MFGLGWEFDVHFLGKVHCMCKNGCIDIFHASRESLWFEFHVDCWLHVVDQCINLSQVGGIDIFLGQDVMDAVLFDA